MTAENTINPTHLAFCGHVTYLLPHFVPVLKEHIEDNNDCVLPHVLLGDMTRCFETSFGEAWTLVFVQIIEDGLSSPQGEQLKGFVAVSFIWNLRPTRKYRDFFESNGLKQLIRLFDQNFGKLS